MKDPYQVDGFHLFLHIVPFQVYTLLPAMLQGLDAGQEEIFFSHDKKVIHSVNDVIITRKMAIG